MSCLDAVTYEKRNLQALECRTDDDNHFCTSIQNIPPGNDLFCIDMMNMNYCRKVKKGDALGYFISNPLGAC